MDNCGYCCSVFDFGGSFIEDCVWIYCMIFLVIYDKCILDGYDGVCEFYFVVLFGYKDCDIVVVVGLSYYVIWFFFGGYQSVMFIDVGFGLDLCNMFWGLFDDYSQVIKSELFYCWE